MKRRVTREVVIFTMLLVTLALQMHSDLFSAPLTRFHTMQNRGNYTHPLLYSTAAYLLLLLVRWVAGVFVRRVHRRFTSSG